jgi:hypothetical protein
MQAEQWRAVGAAARHDMQEHLAAGCSGTEQGRQDHEPVMQRGRAEADVEQQAEAEGDETRPLEETQGAGQLAQHQLQEEGRSQHQRDDQQAQGVELMSESGQAHGVHR